MDPIMAMRCRMNALAFAVQLEFTFGKADRKPAGKADRKPDRRHLHRHFGPKGAPGPGEKGYRAISPARQQAEGAAAEAWRLMGSDDGWHFAAAAAAATGELLEGVEPDDGEPWATVDPEDLPDFLGMPGMPPFNAGEVFLAVLRMNGIIPDPIAREIIADAIHPAGKLRLVNVSKDEAVAFISEHHSTMPIANLRGIMYAIGIMKGGRLVAVATAGHPTGRWGGARVDPQNIVELTRVASDGTVKGASSKLVARLIDILDKSRRGTPNGPTLFVTYQLADEEGTTYRALRDKGLRPVALIEGKAAGGGGAREGNELDYAAPAKIRWEAGPAALPANWHLLDKEHDQ